MAQRNLLGANAVIFGLIALAHLVRVMWSWPVSIGSWEVPIWASWVVFVIFGWLAAMSWQASSR